MLPRPLLSNSQNSRLQTSYAYNTRMVLFKCEHQQYNTLLILAPIQLSYFAYAFFELFAPAFRPILPYMFFHSLAFADLSPLTHSTGSFSS